MITLQVDSAIGEISYSVDRGALVGLRFGHGHRHGHGHGPDHGIGDAIRRFFDGEIDAFAHVELAPAGTTFQKRVWNALLAIEPGTTVSYGAIARAIGAPHAARAIGAANAANPIAIAIPCHRVVGADGTLTGYAFGVERKKWLLDHERRFAGNISARRVSSM